MLSENWLAKIKNKKNKNKNKKAQPEMSLRTYYVLVKLDRARQAGKSGWRTHESRPGTSSSVLMLQCPDQNGLQSNQLLCTPECLNNQKIGSLICRERNTNGKKTKNEMEMKNDNKGGKHPATKAPPSVTAQKNQMSNNIRKKKSGDIIARDDRQASHKPRALVQSRWLVGQNITR